MRSGLVTGSKDLLPDQVKLLQGAVREVAQELKGRAIVFDKSATTSSQAPLLLFAREDRDISDRVKVVFDRLSQEAVDLAKRAP